MLKAFLYRIIIVFFCSLFNVIYTGLSSGTLVKTVYGFVPIEQLKRGDSIYSQGEDGLLVENRVIACNMIFDESYEIKTQRESIIISGSQQIYDKSHQTWKQVCDISGQEVFVDCNGNDVKCFSCVGLCRKQFFYELMLESPHTFFATSSEILFHNIVPFIMLSFSFGGGIAFEGFMLGLGIFGITFFKDFQSKNKCKINVIIPCSQGNGSAPNPEDPEKQENKQCPHGVYEDAPYHHRNSKGLKNKSPKNGQKALDNSIQIKDTSLNRIGVSEDEFVVLKRTTEKLYHGYVAEWSELTQIMKNMLIEAGYASRSGKILCN